MRPCTNWKNPMKAQLVQIRAAIVAESVSYGELAELESIATLHPELLAGDMLLQEWAGVPEDQAR